MACSPLDASEQQQLTEVVVGALHADPMLPLCFNLQSSGAFVRVRMPSGEVASWSLPLEEARREGAGAASPQGASGGGGGGGGVGSLFGGLFAALGGGAAVGVGRARRPPVLPLRVEVSLCARTRRVVVRLGSSLEGGQGMVWVPALFFTHRYSATPAETSALASLQGWGARAREVGESIDAQSCDQPRVAPLLALLAASRGPLRWEVRRLAAMRRGLLDEIKAVMAACSAGAGGGEEGGAGEEGMSSGAGGGGGGDAAREALRIAAELGKIRDDVGALTVRVAGGEEAGGEGSAAPPAARAAPTAEHERLSAQYREAFHNAQLCSAYAAGEEMAEAAEAAQGARGRGFGLHLPLPPAHAGAAVAALRCESAALFAAARMAAREKEVCLKAHFGATTPRSKIERLEAWVQDCVEFTGNALKVELAAIAIERSDGIPLLV